MTTQLLSIEKEVATCGEAFRNSEVADMAWHVHHTKLAEPLTEPAEDRIAYILAKKRLEEQALRLRLFRPVKSAAVASARRAYDAAIAPARQAYDAAVASARRAYDAAVAPTRQAYDAAIASAEQAYDAAIASAEQAYDAAVASARRAYDAAVASARQAYDAAVASAEQAYDAAIAPAHSEECPGCPWNGQTIFTGTEVRV